MRKTFDRRGVLDAGIVHQHIHAAPGLLGFRDHGGNLVRLRHVGSGVSHLDAMALGEAGPQRLDLGRVAEAVHHQGGALLCQRRGDAEPDATRGARDDRDFSTQTHSVSPAQARRVNRPVSTCDNTRVPATIPQCRPSTTRVRLLSLAFLVAGLPHAGHARPLAFPITPATTKLGLTVYAVGIFPMLGDYRSFRGTLELDSDKPGFCRVSITVEQASLTMADASHVRTALAPDMLDAAAYPTMHFEGVCQGEATVGSLTLHGVTHPLSLALKQTGKMLVGEGRIQRRDYAINGMPHLLGQLIRIRFSTTLPMLQTSGSY